MIHFVTNKFQKKTLIIPKTIEDCNNFEVKSKICIHNHVLFNLINRWVHPHTPIVSSNLDLNITPQTFCRDGIRFSFCGNDFFTDCL